MAVARGFLILVILRLFNSAAPKSSRACRKSSRAESLNLPGVRWTFADALRFLEEFVRKPKAILSKKLLAVRLVPLRSPRALRSRNLSSRRRAHRALLSEHRSIQL